MRAKTAPHARRSRRQVALAIVVGLVVVGLCGVSLFGSWRSVSKQDAATADELAGIAYAKPLSALVESLAMAASAAAAGVPVDSAPLEASVRAVAAEDVAIGGRLGASRRWADLKSRVDPLIDGSGPHNDAAFLGSAESAVDLMAQISATAGLALDSNASTHFLADASLGQLPGVMLTAASAASAFGDGTLDAGRAAAYAAARYELALESDRVDASLETAMAAAGGAVGSDLIGHLDAFQSAVAATGPTTFEQPGSFAAVLAPGAMTHLQAAALALDQTILGHVHDLLLDQRARNGAQQRDTVGEAVGILVGAIAFIWLLSPRRRVTLTDTEGDEAAAERVEEPQIALIGARDLLGLEELVHVGRAVQARRRTNDDAE
jgi:hypothetical protein